MHVDPCVAIADGQGEHATALALKWILHLNMSPSPAVSSKSCCFTSLSFSLLIFKIGVMLHTLMCCFTS